MISIRQFGEQHSFHFSGRNVCGRIAGLEAKIRTHSRYQAGRHLLLMMFLSLAILLLPMPKGWHTSGKKTATQCRPQLINEACVRRFDSCPLCILFSAMVCF